MKPFLLALVYFVEEVLFWQIL